MNVRQREWEMGWKVREREISNRLYLNMVIVRFYRRNHLEFNWRFFQTKSGKRKRKRKRNIDKETSKCCTHACSTCCYSKSSVEKIKEYSTKLKWWALAIIYAEMVAQKEKEIDEICTEFRVHSPIWNDNTFARFILGSHIS